MAATDPTAPNVGPLPNPNPPPPQANNIPLTPRQQIATQVGLQVMNLVANLIGVAPQSLHTERLHIGGGVLPVTPLATPPTQEPFEIIQRNGLAAFINDNTIAWHNILVAEGISNADSETLIPFLARAVWNLSRLQALMKEGKISEISKANILVGISYPGNRIDHITPEKVESIANNMALILVNDKSKIEFQLIKKALKKALQTALYPQAEIQLAQRTCDKLDQCQEGRHHATSNAFKATREEFINNILKTLTSTPPYLIADLQPPVIFYPGTLPHLNRDYLQLLKLAKDTIASLPAEYQCPEAERYLLTGFFNAYHIPAAVQIDMCAQSIKNVLLSSLTPSLANLSQDDLEAVNTFVRDLSVSIAIFIVTKTVHPLPTYNGAPLHIQQGYIGKIIQGVNIMRSNEIQERNNMNTLLINALKQNHLTSALLPPEMSTLNASVMHCANQLTCIDPWNNDEFKAEVENIFSEVLRPIIEDLTTHQKNNIKAYILSLIEVVQRTHFGHTVFLPNFNTIEKIKELPPDYSLNIVSLCIRDLEESLPEIKNTETHDEILLLTTGLHNILGLKSPQSLNFQSYARLIATLGLKSVEATEGIGSYTATCVNMLLENGENAFRLLDERNSRGQSALFNLTQETLLPLIVQRMRTGSGSRIAEDPSVRLVSDLLLHILFPNGMESIPLPDIQNWTGRIAKLFMKLGKSKVSSIDARFHERRETIRTNLETEINKMVNTEIATWFGMSNLPPHWELHLDLRAGIDAVVEYLRLDSSPESAGKAFQIFIYNLVRENTTEILHTVLKVCSDTHMQKVLLTVGIASVLSILEEEGSLENLIGSVSSSSTSTEPRRRSRSNSLLQLVRRNSISQQDHPESLNRRLCRDLVAQSTEILMSATFDKIEKNSLGKFTLSIGKKPVQDRIGNQTASVLGSMIGGVICEQILETVLRGCAFSMTAPSENTPTSSTDPTLRENFAYALMSTEEDLDEYLDEGIKEICKKLSDFIASKVTRAGLKMAEIYTKGGKDFQILAEDLNRGIQTLLSLFTEKRFILQFLTAALTSMSPPAQDT